MVELLNQMAQHEAETCTLLQLFTRTRATILQVSPFNGRFNDPREMYKHPEPYPSNRRPSPLRPVNRRSKPYRGELSPRGAANQRGGDRV